MESESGSAPAPKGPARIRAVVRGITRATHDLAAMTLEPEDPLPILPGQYVTVGLEVHGAVVERPYSVASEPAQQSIDLMIERVTGGKLSEKLYELSAGNQVWLRPAARGRFLHAAAGANWSHRLLIATVTGVAPFRSLLRSEAETLSDHPVSMLWGASHANELIYHAEFSRLAESGTGFAYVPTVSRPRENPDWTGERGRVDDLVRKYLDRLSVPLERVGCWLCGHPEMIRNTSSILERAGLSPTQVHVERYWAG